MPKRVPSKVTEVHLVYNNKVKSKDRPQIESSKDAFLILSANWSNQIGLLEEFYVLLLDNSNRVMAISLVAKGGIASTLVDLRIVFATALKGRSSALILAHNHPSGNLKPSHQDISLTNKFIKAGNLLDIKILDHLILTPDQEYLSFNEEGLIP